MLSRLKLCASEDKEVKVLRYCEYNGNKELLYMLLLKFKSNLSVTVLRLNHYTDLNKISHGDTLFLEKGHELLFSAITDIHTTGT